MSLYLPVASSANMQQNSERRSDVDIVGGAPSFDIISAHASAAWRRPAALIRR